MNRATRDLIVREVQRQWPMIEDEFLSRQEEVLNLLAEGGAKFSQIEAVGISYAWTFGAGLLGATATVTVLADKDNPDDYRAYVTLEGAAGVGASTHIGSPEIGVVGYTGRFDQYSGYFAGVQGSALLGAQGVVSIPSLDMAFQLSGSITGTAMLVGSYTWTLGDFLNSTAEQLSRGHENLDQLCFSAGTSIDMWPVDPSLKPIADGTYDRKAVLANIWTKPIEQITPDDIVVSFDANGHLKPGTVTRLFTNDVKIILDFFGTGVTPGHVYYRADSGKANKYETLIDILRADGVIEAANGTQIRAATGLAITDPRDGFVRAVTGELDANGQLVPKSEGFIRRGTRIILDDGKDVCVEDFIVSGNATVTEDGMIRTESGEDMPFHWAYSAELPKPEDYILKRSGTTLEAIYRAAEWESQRPTLPAPLLAESGPVRPSSTDELSVMPRNRSLAESDDAYKEAEKPVLGLRARAVLQ